MDQSNKQQIVADIRRTLLIALADLGASRASEQTTVELDGEDIIVKVDTRTSIDRYLKHQHPLQVLADSLRYSGEGVYS